MKTTFISFVTFITLWVNLLISGVCVSNAHEKIVVIPLKSACEEFVHCDGNPYGGITNDPCGICGGDGSSCAGCDGVPNSGNIVDICGVCGGNGSTCSKTCSYTSVDQGGYRKYVRDCTGVNDKGQTEREIRTYKVYYNETTGHSLQQAFHIADAAGTQISQEISLRSTIHRGGEESQYSMMIFQEDYSIYYDHAYENGCGDDVRYYGAYYDKSISPDPYKGVFPSDWESNNCISFPNRCTEVCTTNYEAVKDWVLLNTPDKFKLRPIGCHGWWDRYDHQGNWVECEE